MFGASNSTKRKPKKDYGVPRRVKYEEGDLWDVPTAEYKAWDVPQLVLNVLDADGPALHYESIKHTLESVGVPTHLGYVWLAVYELEAVELVEVVRKPTAKVLLIQRRYEDF